MHPDKQPATTLFITGEKFAEVDTLMLHLNQLNEVKSTVLTGRLKYTVSKKFPPLNSL